MLYHTLEGRVYLCLSPISTNCEGHSADEIILYKGDTNSTFLVQKGMVHGVAQTEHYGTLDVAMQTIPYPSGIRNASVYRPTFSDGLASEMQFSKQTDYWKS